jgi:hypothetical protein
VPAAKKTGTENLETGGTNVDAHCFSALFGFTVAFWMALTVGFLLSGPFTRLLAAQQSGNVAGVVSDPSSARKLITSSGFCRRKQVAQKVGDLTGLELGG